MFHVIFARVWFAYFPGCRCIHYCCCRTDYFYYLKWYYQNYYSIKYNHFYYIEQRLLIIPRNTCSTGNPALSLKSREFFLFSCSLLGCNGNCLTCYNMNTHWQELSISGGISQSFKYVLLIRLDQKSTLLHSCVSLPPLATEDSFQKEQEIPNLSVRCSMMSTK